MSETSKTSTDEPVDISATIDALCEQFGFDKTRVTWISFEPTTLTFEVVESMKAPFTTVPHVFKVTT
jgi:hypothetical protein